MDKSKLGSKPKKEVVILKNQLARALADYDNLRKRIEREKEGLEKTVNLRLILKLLSVLDAFESAQEHLGDQGLAIAIGEFKKVLNEEGLEEIRPKLGNPFDHSVHEVIESVGGGKKGEIAELVLPGWRFKDGPIARVAKVKVFGPNPLVDREKKEEQEKETARKEYV